MGKFFESDMVREELTEINQLQQEIYSSTMSFPTMSRKDKLEHIDKLTELLEKQKIMYARLSLSDDPEAKELLSTLKSSIALMGLGIKHRTEEVAVFLCHRILPMAILEIQALKFLF